MIQIVIKISQINLNFLITSTDIKNSVKFRFYKNDREQPKFVFLLTGQILKLLQNRQIPCIRIKANTMHKNKFLQEYKAEYKLIT